MRNVVEIFRKAFRRKEKQDNENLIEGITRTLIEVANSMTKKINKKKGKKKKVKTTSQGTDNDASSVSVSSDPEPEDSSNLIHVGGIADFHESDLSKVLLMKKSFKTFMEETRYTLERMKRDR